MSKTISVKLPSPLEKKLADYMEKADKDNRNSVVCELLEKALLEAEKGQIMDEGTDPKLQELAQLCSTKVALQVNRAVSEILRYTYDSTKSQFPECKTVDEVVEKIGLVVNKTMARYTDKKGAIEF